MKEIKGIIIPAVTPFDEDGALRLDWLQENYRKWCQTDICGIMSLGTNGEFKALSDDEAFDVIAAGAEAVREDKVFIAGVGRESTAQTVAFLQRLADADVAIDYVSVLTPHYFKKLMTDDALIGYYTEIADASRWPVLLYCAPGYANGVVVSPEALKKLADHPNIAGIKDTSPDMMASYLEAVGGRDDFEIIAGSLGSFLLCTTGGGKAGIISTSNAYPQTCAVLAQILETEGMEAAKAFHAELTALGDNTTRHGGVAGVKASMNVMGFRAGWPRRPVMPCSDETIAVIRDYIEAHRDFIRDLA